MWQQDQQLAVTVNIEQDGTLNDLATGLTKLLLEC